LNTAPDPTGPPVLVTGSNGVLMAAIAASLAPRHPLLLHVHERTDRAAAIASSAEPLLHADLASPDGPAGLAAAVRKQAPVLSGMVLGAASFVRTPLDRLADGDTAIREVLALDLAAPLELVHALHATVADGGRIVLLTDAGARAGWPSYDAYVAARTGLEGAVRSLARALGPRLVVFALAPGLVDGATAPFPPRLALEGTALGRPAAAAEVARALERAWTLPPAVLHGAVLTVDGGLALHTP